MPGIPTLMQVTTRAATCTACTRIARGVLADVLAHRAGRHRRDQGRSGARRDRPHRLSSLRRAAARGHHRRSRRARPEAQNALLKTLEEPPPASVFVLDHGATRRAAADRPLALPAAAGSVRSRRPTSPRCCAGSRCGASRRQGGGRGVGRQRRARAGRGSRGGDRGARSRRQRCCRARPRRPIRAGASTARRRSSAARPSATSCRGGCSRCPRSSAISGCSRAGGRTRGSPTPISSRGCSALLRSFDARPRRRALSPVDRRGLDRARPERQLRRSSPTGWRCISMSAPSAPFVSVKFTPAGRTLSFLLPDSSIGPRRRCPGSSSGRCRGRRDRRRARRRHRRRASRRRWPSAASPPPIRPNVVVRRASHDDVVQRLKQQQREQDAQRVAQLKIRERGLPMKLTQGRARCSTGRG